MDLPGWRIFQEAPATKIIMPAGEATRKRGVTAVVKQHTLAVSEAGYTLAVSEARYTLQLYGTDTSRSTAETLKSISY